MGLLGLGRLKSRLLHRTPISKLPLAHYEIPAPSGAGSDLMISFYDAETHLPVRAVFLRDRGVVRVSFPPVQRVYLKYVWLDGDYLTGERHDLGPTSRFLKRPSVATEERDLM